MVDSAQRTTLRVLRASRSGAVLKIVLAEKVSPSTLAIFLQEPGWLVVTADKIASLPDELADVEAIASVRLVDL